MRLRKFIDILLIVFKFANFILPNIIQELCDVPLTIINAADMYRNTNQSADYFAGAILHSANFIFLAPSWWANVSLLNTTS
jgi:hypothetical protein